jgi:hypothetical protein
MARQFANGLTATSRVFPYLSFHFFGECHGIPRKEVAQSAIPSGIAASTMCLNIIVLVNRLNAFVKLRNVTISFVMSFRLSAWKN